MLDGLRLIRDMKPLLCERWVDGMQVTMSGQMRAWEDVSVLTVNRPMGFAELLMGTGSLC